MFSLQSFLLDDNDDDDDDNDDVISSIALNFQDHG